MSMQPAAWPEPDPLIAAAITGMYGSRKTERPLAVAIRDRLGQWLADEDFAAAFGVRGKPGWSPSRLALVTVLQRAEKLTDRLAAEAVRTRIDWKYLLGLAVDDPGFDHTVLSEFRAKVAQAGLEQVTLDALLARLAADGLVKAGGKQRTDSTHVVAAVAALNRLELAGESVRAAVEALATAHPDWLAQRICVSDWTARYGTPMTAWRPPASQARQAELAITYARDGYALLEAVHDKTAPPWRRERPAVDVLRQVLLQNYTRTITADGREVIKRRQKEPEGDGLPPGHTRIASPYDTDARWGVKRDTFWLGYKLHVSETCDDQPGCGCPGVDPGEGGTGRGGHDKDCAAPAFPNLITHVATTDATVTDNQMTPVIDDALAGKALAPGRHYLDSGYLSTEVPRIKVVPSRGQGLSRQRVIDYGGHLVVGDRGVGGGHVGDQVRERRCRAVLVMATPAGPALAGVDAGAAASRLVVAGFADVQLVAQPEGVPLDAPPGVGVVRGGDPGMARRQTIALGLLLPPLDHLPAVRGDGAGVVLQQHLSQHVHGRQFPQPGWCRLVVDGLQQRVPVPGVGDGQLGLPGLRGRRPPRGHRRAVTGGPVAHTDPLRQPVRVRRGQRLHRGPHTFPGQLQPVQRRHRGNHMSGVGALLPAGLDQAVSGQPGQQGVQRHLLQPGLGHLGPELR